MDQIPAISVWPTVFVESKFEVRACGLDIRHNARKLVAEISLKTKKNQKKFPEVVVF